MSRKSKLSELPERVRTLSAVATDGAGLAGSQGGRSALRAEYQCREARCQVATEAKSKDK